MVKESDMVKPQQSDCHHFTALVNNFCQTQNPPLFSIVVVLPQSSHLLSQTLESVFRQTFNDYEVLLVKNASVLDPEDVLPKENIRIVMAEGETIAAFLNKGISHAKGKYIHFLYPGDSYLAYHSLEYVKKNLSEKEVDFLYCGNLSRNREGFPEALLHPLSQEVLKSGKLPSRLCSFWFSRALFEKVGLFQEKRHYRPGFDFICRIFLREGLEYLFMPRILVDYDFFPIPFLEKLKFNFKTSLVIRKYYGLTAAIKNFLYTS